MDDMISRQAAIEAMRKAKDKSELHRMLIQLPSAQPGCEDTVYRKAVQMLLAYFVPEERYAEAVDGLRRLPSAQPEQRWISCSERLPDEHEWLGTKKFGTTISNEVYVTFETPDGERFAKHISFQNGKLSSVDEQRMKVWFKGAKPIAWMPLPEPYQEGGE